MSEALNDVVTGPVSGLSYRYGVGTSLTILKTH
jgi:hypothetical protein